MEEQVKSFQLSPAPDKNHHKRVIMYGIGAIFLLILGMGIGYLIGINNTVSYSIKPQTETLKQNSNTTILSISPSPTDDQILNMLPTLEPEFQWQQVKTAQFTYPLTSNTQLSGEQRIGTQMVQDANSWPTPSFAPSHIDLPTLLKNGWNEDITLDTGGVGGGQQGFNKFEGGKERILVWGTSIGPLVPSANGPDVLKCPCTRQTTVFISNPF